MKSKITDLLNCIEDIKTEKQRTGSNIYEQNKYDALESNVKDLNLEAGIKVVKEISDKLIKKHGL